MGSTRHQPQQTRSLLGLEWSRTDGTWSCQRCRPQRAPPLRDRSRFGHRRRQGRMSSSRKNRRRSKIRGCSCMRGRPYIRGTSRIHKIRLLLWLQRRSCMHLLLDIQRSLRSHAHRRRRCPRRRSHQGQPQSQPPHRHLWCCKPHNLPMGSPQAAGQSRLPRSCTQLEPGYPRFRVHRTPRRRRRR